MMKQLPMFPGPELDADARLNAAQAEMRLQQMQRSEARPRFRAQHHRSVSAPCPSCGACVTIRVS